MVRPEIAQAVGVEPLLTREAQVPVDETVRMALQIADPSTTPIGTAWVHQDVKPSTLCVSGVGR